RVERDPKQYENSKRNARKQTNEGLLHTLPAGVCLHGKLERLWVKPVVQFVCPALIFRERASWVNSQQRFDQVLRFPQIRRFHGVTAAARNLLEVRPKLRHLLGISNYQRLYHGESVDAS